MSTMLAKLRQNTISACKPISKTRRAVDRAIVSKKKCCHRDHTAARAQHRDIDMFDAQVLIHNHNDAQQPGSSDVLQRQGQLESQRTFSFVVVTLPNGRSAQKTLGRGTFGQVVEVERTAAPKTRYALKSIDIRPFPYMVARELAVTSIAARHPGSVHVESISFDFGKNQAHMIMELMDGHLGGLSVRLSPTDRATLAPSLIFQVITALSHVHGHNIMHRDIKPSNILFHARGAHASEAFRDYTFKLADYGLARLANDEPWLRHEHDPSPLSPEVTPSTGEPRETQDHSFQSALYSVTAVTVGYRPPEMFIRPMLMINQVAVRRYHCGIDVWALGVTIVEFLTGRKLFCSIKLKNSDRNSLTHEQEDHIIGCHMLETMAQTIDMAFWSAIAMEPSKKAAIRRGSARNSGHGLRGYLCQNNVCVEPSVIDLLERLLDPNPDTRITAREALAHPCIGQFARLLNPQQLTLFLPDDNIISTNNEDQVHGPSLEMWQRDLFPRATAHLISDEPIIRKISIACKESGSSLQVLDFCVRLFEAHRATSLVWSIGQEEASRGQLGSNGVAGKQKALLAHAAACVGIAHYLLSSVEPKVQVISRVFQIEGLTRTTMCERSISALHMMRYSLPPLRTDLSDLVCPERNVHPRDIRPNLPFQINPLHMCWAQLETTGRSAIWSELVHRFTSYHDVVESLASL